MTRTVAAPTRSTLADGRETLFFALAAPPRIHEDRRDLPARAPGSPTELRSDTQLGDWVMMAPTRQERTYKPPRTMCPLCPDADGLSSEIPANGYDVAVFENRFPSLSSARAGSGFILPPPAGYGTAVDGYGRCEVVCFSSDHDGSFSKLTARHARLVIDAWTERTRDLLGRDGIEEVHCFENRGEEIGVTLSHPHGQIYAYPFLTHRTATVLTRARGHRHATGRNLFSEALMRKWATFWGSWPRVVIDRAMSAKRPAASAVMSSTVRPGRNFSGSVNSQRSFCWFSGVPMSSRRMVCVSLGVPVKWVWISVSARLLTTSRGGLSRASA